MQDDISRKDEMMLMLDYGIFYEFIPMEEIEKEYPKAVSLDDVEIGKNYAVIISTNAGWTDRVYNDHRSGKGLSDVFGRKS